MFLTCLFIVYRYWLQSWKQRYDLDPAAKAAAATVLASKLGADSGLKMFLGDEKNPNAPLGKSSDVEPVQSTGLRNRRPSHIRSHSTGSTGSTGILQFTEEATNELEAENEEAAFQNKMVEHYRGPPPTDGSILSRLVAFLVGEDPAQSYALICGNCRMHNGEFLLLNYIHVKSTLLYSLITWINIHRTGPERGFSIHNILLPALPRTERTMPTGHPWIRF